MSRLTTNYTITVSGTSFVITYASTYSSVSFSVYNYVFNQLGTTNYFLFGPQGRESTLDYTKCTSPVAGSLSALRTAVIALIPSGGGGGGGSITDLIPSADATYNLGSSAFSWLELFIANITAPSSQNITFTCDSNKSIIINSGSVWNARDGTVGKGAINTSYSDQHFIATNAGNNIGLYTGVISDSGPRATIQCYSPTLVSALPLIINPTGSASVQVGQYASTITDKFYVNGTARIENTATIKAIAAPTGQNLTITVDPANFVVTNRIAAPTGENLILDCDSANSIRITDGSLWNSRTESPGKGANPDSFDNEHFIATESTGRYAIYVGLLTDTDQRGTIQAYDGNTFSGLPLCLSPNGSNVNIGEYSAARSEKLWVNGNARIEDTFAVQGITTLTGGLRFPNSEGGTVASMTNYAEQANTLTSGGALATSITFDLTRAGRIVTMHVRAFSGTTTSAAQITITGSQLPNGFRPITTCIFNIPVIDGASNAAGVVTITSTGDITFAKLVGTGNWSSGTTAGLPQAVGVSYRGNT